MGENVVKNGFLSGLYEGNKGRFRFCHPDKKSSLKRGFLNLSNVVFIQKLCCTL